MRLKESSDSRGIRIYVISKNVAGACLAFALLVLLSAVVFFSTKEETLPASSSAVVAAEKVPRMGIDCMDSQANPLKLNDNEEVKRAVLTYYRQSAEKSKFAEEYQNLIIYTKLGPYEGSYIAFVEYDMKIRDIYTPVPGLGTVYVETDPEDGQVRTFNKMEDEAVSSLISSTAGHEDVQALAASVQVRYEEALLSDSLLKEALEGLKQTYEQG